MPDIYNNFGISVDPDSTPSSNYGSFGVVNSTLNGLSTTPNIVTQSVSPQALNSGVLNGNINSSNFVHGVSGWQIRSDGSAEFQNVTGLSFSGATITGSFINGSSITGGSIVGSTFSTDASLPASGSGIYIDSASGFSIYNSGNILLNFSQNNISFNTPLGIACAEFLPFSTNQFSLVIAGSGTEYDFNTSYFGASINTADLGTSGTPWGTVYYVTLHQVSDIRIKQEVSKMAYGLEHVLRMEPISYTFRGEKRIGFSAQDISKIVPEVTKNCNESSVVGTASINQVDLIPVLVNAIKELKDEIDQLRGQISKNMV